MVDIAIRQGEIGKTERMRNGIEKSQIINGVNGEEWIVSSEKGSVLLSREHKGLLSTAPEGWKIRTKWERMTVCGTFIGHKAYGIDHRGGVGDLQGVRRLKLISKIDLPPLENPVGWSILLAQGEIGTKVKMKFKVTNRNMRGSGTNLQIGTPITVERWGKDGFGVGMTPEGAAGWVHRSEVTPVQEKEVEE